MEIEQSSLYREVQAITQSDAKPVHFSYTAEIHVGDDTFAPLKILSVDFLSDYETKYADEIQIELVFYAGTFLKRIYPFKDNIDITLFKRPLMETSDSSDEDATVETERYTATLIDTGNPLLESNGFNSPDEEALNLTNIPSITFQLVNKSLEQLRTISVGQNFRQCKVQDVITGMLTKFSQTVKVEGGRLLKGVDMVDASNKQTREHIIIPQGVKLVHLPEYVHRKCGGVYNAGLGYYLQGDYWYVYPCYNTERWPDAVKTLTVINIPKNKLPGIERTYRQDGNSLVVLATGEVRFTDDSEVQQLNHGNGVRFADASNMMNNFSTTKDNKTISSRSKNNNEFVAVERKSGNNNIQLSNNPITSNPFLEYSKLARRLGSILSFEWENSDPSTIFPGMMTKIMYLDGDDLKEIYGVVLRAHHYVHMKGIGLTDTRHICHSALSVFVKKPED